MRAIGVSLDMIAASLNLSPRPIANDIGEFPQGGLKATMEERSHGPQSGLEPFLDKMKEDSQREPVGCAKQARRRISHLTDIPLWASPTRRIMRRPGMRSRKAGQVPGKADAQRQLECLDETLRPKLQEAAAGKRKVFFVDACPFVMGAVVGMLWRFPRIFVPGASGRQRDNVLGALDSQSPEVIPVSKDTSMTAPTVGELLDKLRAAPPRYSHIPGAR